MNAAAGVIEAPDLVRDTQKVRTYEAWKAAALAHDTRSGADRWRSEDRSRRYDYKVIRRRYDEIRAVKATRDPLALL